MLTALVLRLTLGVAARVMAAIIRRWRIADTALFPPDTAPGAPG